MERHKLGTYAAGIAAMKDVCNLLNVGIDPQSTFQEYTEEVGSDLNAAPIPAGLPVAAWHWESMSQEDFNILLGFVAVGTGTGTVYIRTRQNSGTTGYDFSNYLAVMKRPVAESREGLLMRNVNVEFVAMVWQS